MKIKCAWMCSAICGPGKYVLHRNMYILVLQKKMNDFFKYFQLNWSHSIQNLIIQMSDRFCAAISTIESLIHCQMNSVVRLMYETDIRIIIRLFVVYTTKLHVLGELLHLLLKKFKTTTIFTISTLELTPKYPVWQ